MRGRYVPQPTRRGVSARVAHLDAALVALDRAVGLAERAQREPLLEHEVGETGEAGEPLLGARERIARAPVRAQRADEAAHERRRELVARARLEPVQQLP